MTHTRALVCPSPPPRRIPAANVARELVVLSDSTANLARHVLAAVLTQFPPGAASVRFESFARTPARVDEVLRAAGPGVAGVCHAIVAGALKRRVAAQCAKAGIPCSDL